MAESALLKCARLTLGEADAQRIIDAAFRLSPRHYVYILLSINTGARVGEVARIEVEDLDERGNAILIHVQKKKKPAPRWRKVHPELIPEVRYCLRKMGIESGPIFPGRVGANRHTTTRTLQSLYYQAAEAAGVDVSAPASLPNAHGRGPHSQRHTRGTWLANVHADMATIMNQLGHENVATSLVYIAGSRVKEKVALLPSVLDQCASKHEIGIEDGRLAQLAKKFWLWVDKRGEDQCWVWTGRLTRDGYGEIDVHGMTRHSMLAHRAAWIVCSGTIPDGLLVCHKCDNRPCCNPRHLFLGTHQDNSRDMVEKGRSPRGEKSGWRLHPERFPVGSEVYNAKLSEDQVTAMRKDFSLDGVQIKTIAAKYGISHQHAGDIVHGKKWKHVPVLENP